MSKVRAQDNFYDYINKQWEEQTPLPEGYPSWGCFEILHKKSIDDIKEMILEFCKKQDLTEDQKKIVNLFNNYLNQEQRNKQKIEPIMPILNLIDSLDSKNNFTNFIIEIYQKYQNSFFHSKSIDSDFKNSDIRALMIDSMGLGMSDRDFYQESHPRHNEIKQAYKTYLHDLCKCANLKLNTNDVFELVYNFEKTLSQSMMKQEELRVPENIYNVVSLQQLNELNNFIDWKKYLTATGHAKAQIIFVTEPKFFKKLNETLNNISLNDLKDLLKVKVLISYSKILSIDLYEINFKYSSVFSGVKEMKPEIDRAVEFTNNVLGDLLGQEYIKKHFSQQAKDDVLKIVKDLIKVYEKRIKNLDWMSEQTKEKAIDKLNSYTIKIGYPDKFEDYSKIEIRSYQQNGSLFENLENIYKHFLEKDLREINLPVDKTKWYMDPQTVNAYYNPSSNEICFPAAILQKPFYDINQEKAKNLGGIGATIGHEVSHGFDDEGSKFDKNGNLNNWWTKEDYEKYNLRTKKLEEQYNQYQVNGVNVNGKLTLGENIGDLSGLQAALDICKEQCKDDLKLFFENYALTWRRKATDELKNTRLLIDPHSPEEFRCNGVLINIDEFHEIYQTKPGDLMYLDKEKRIKIW